MSDWGGGNDGGREVGMQGCGGEVDGARRGRVRARYVCT